jgi:predicted RND superfamily exporter protein
MVSLGVDFAIHALKRIQEERKISDEKFFFFGMSGVLGALTLALLTDSTAFIANAFSGVESVIYFGLAATLATFLSYLVLGIIVPLSYSKILPLIKNKRSISEKIVRQINFLSTPILSGTGVISVVVFGDLLGSDFLAMLLGFVISLLLLFLNILLPIYLNKKSSQGLLKKEENYKRTFDDKLAKYFFLISKRYYLVLPISIVITIFAAIGALNLQSEFDVKDFFDNKSDFVIGLEKYQEYSSGSRGEPAQILFEGDITNPEFLKDFEKFKSNLEKVKFIGLDSNGNIYQEGILNPLKVSKLIFENPNLKEKIEITQNIKITDTNNDQIPDSKIQIQEILKYGFENGLSVKNKFSYDPRWFQRYFWYNQETNNDFTTIFLVLLSETSSEDDVEQVRNDINTTIRETNFSKDIKIGVTGSPFSRLDQLNASTDAMRRSIPIAAGGSFLIILIILRSFRYAIATIIPIGLVVVWLYGIMYIFNFSLNYVTATIGAISLGVGVDFSIHMTMRFREEIKKRNDSIDALLKSINGTGMALLASAVSSILGFAIMGFAPMPLFSTFGILTSIMIFLALTVSLFVLPSLLILIHKNTTK